MDLQQDSDFDLIEVPADNSAAEGIERLYMPGESLFGATGYRMRQRGWTVFPQSRDESRKPAVVDGQTLKWGQYKDAPPSLATTKRWSDQAAGYNTAIVLGPSSGNTICLDIDVTDRNLAWDIEELADEVFGKTPFRRIGAAPKLALFYRFELAEDLPANRSYMLMEPDGETKSPHMVEILSKGKPITSHGYHHRTGRYFEWVDKNPSQYGPEHATLITKEQLDVFITRLEEIRGFFRNNTAGGADVDWDVVPDGDLQRPRLRQYEDTAEWTEDENGIVVDGREKFLYKLARFGVRMNARRVLNPETNEIIPEGLSQVKAMVVEQFMVKAESSGRWTETYVRDDVHSKVTRFANQLRTGELLPWSPARRNDPKLKPSKKYQVEKPVGNDLGFINRNRVNLERAVSLDGVIESRRAERALQPDRTEIAANVQLGLTTALDAFFEQVYQPRAEGEVVVHPIHVLKAPTGAGKTTRTIRYIAADARTKKWDEARALGLETPGPIIFLLPTYQNISELKLRAEVLNLDASLNDSELAEQAKERGLISIDDLDTVMADLRRDAMAAGLETMIYKGKVAAGCLMQDKVKMLMDSGIGTSGLCHAKVVKKDEEPEEKFCVHYHTCPAIQQRKQIAKSHVVFLPHAFLTLSIPEELKNVRAVIADERIFTLFVHTTTFYRSTLFRGRKEPTLTKKEREAGMSPDEVLSDRDLAAKIAVEAMSSGLCPANELAAYKEKRPKAIVRGYDLVKSAARVCGSAISANAMITPDMTDADIAELCAKPTGAEVREEYRFWKIVQERLEMLMPDLLHEGLAGGLDIGPPRLAKGKREMRIQHLIEEDTNGHQTELVRISWRSEPNWVNAPMLLLDASASPEIVGKIFSGRDVTVHETPAPLNVRTIAVIDRTYANASILNTSKLTSERKSAAKLKEKVQQVIEATSSTFGYGRVVCGSSVALRRAVNTAWAAPSNIDFCHYGAMRGLDFAKYHAAALSVGRMEVPSRTIDGIVAALSYDDDIPEEPFDRNGDGRDLLTNGPLLLPGGMQIMPMRNGQDATVVVPMYPGKWGRIVQQQYREEELRQFVGRLRPVYREGEAPVWIAISKVIPDGIIVDDFVALPDLFRLDSKAVFGWRGARKTDGVLQSDLLLAADPLNRDTRDHWKYELSRLGLNEDTGEIDAGNRLSWGYTPVKYLRSDGLTGFAFVRTEHRDLEHAVRTAFTQNLGWDVSLIDIGTPVKPRQASQTREMDWVGEEIGVMEQRRIDEQNATVRATTEFLLTQQSTSFVESQKTTPIHPPQYNSNSQKSDQLNINEMVAYEGTEMVLAKMNPQLADVVTSPVLGADHEVISETIADDDYDDMVFEIDQF